MRCVDVIRELAAPTGLDSRALDDHLARCPRCASWAERDAKLGQIWEATRPGGTADAWERTWSHVSDVLDGRVAIPSSPPRTWRRPALAVFALAQAAAILVGVIWLSRNGGQHVAPQAPAVAVAAPAPNKVAEAPPVADVPADSPSELLVSSGEIVDIPQGEIAVIRPDKDGAKVRFFAQSDNPTKVDPLWALFNLFEAEGAEAVALR
jgi:hypothetical protein